MKEAVLTIFFPSWSSFFFSMSRRPARRALPPDRFGEAAADEDLVKALTSSSSSDDGEDDDGAGGAAALRRRVTTTTVDESDDDSGGDNVRGADSATTSERPESDSSCDGTKRERVNLCARERTGKERWKQQSRRRCRRPVSSSQCFFFLFFPSHLGRTPLTETNQQKLHAQRKPRPRTCSSTAFWSPRTSRRSSTGAR